MQRYMDLLEEMVLVNNVNEAYLRFVHPTAEWYVLMEKELAMILTFHKMLGAIIEKPRIFA